MNVDGSLYYYDIEQKILDVLGDGEI